MLKTKLKNLKGKWVEYLPEVLWAYRITRKSATQKTPFSLAFGTEAVAPVEVRLKSPRVEFANTEHNEEILRPNLDLLEEKREQVLKRAEDYHRKTTKYYDRRVRPKSFKPGDLVLKKTPTSKERSHTRESRTELGRTLRGIANNPTGQLRTSNRRGKNLATLLER